MVSVKVLWGTQTHDIDIGDPTTTTVADLRAKIAEVTKVPADHQKLAGLKAVPNKPDSETTMAMAGIDKEGKKVKMIGNAVSEEVEKAHAPTEQKWKEDEVPEFQEGSGFVMKVTSAGQFDEWINDPRAPHTIVDFFATWCGPCQMIKPKLAKMAEQYPHVRFIAVDVDAYASISGKYNVSSMPTFLFFEKGKEVHRFSGAQEGMIRAELEKFPKKTSGDKTD